jgi:hypothetical protein
MRKDWTQRPARLVRLYLYMAQKRCLAAGAQVKRWHLVDWAERNKWQFAKSKGTYRCHYWVAHAISLLVFDGAVAQATALLCQMSSAMLQAAMDGGSWDNASPMVPIDDPYARLEFAADYGTMAGIASYRRAVKDLRSQTVGGQEEQTEKAWHTEKPWHGKGAQAAKAEPKKKGGWRGKQEEPAEK